METLTKTVFYCKNIVKMDKREQPPPYYQPIEQPQPTTNLSKLSIFFLFCFGERWSVFYVCSIMFFSN